MDDMSEIDSYEVEAGEAELADHMKYIHGDNLELHLLILDRSLRGLRQHMGLDLGRVVPLKLVDK